MWQRQCIAKASPRCAAKIFISQFQRCAFTTNSRYLAASRPISYFTPANSSFTLNTEFLAPFHHSLSNTIPDWQPTGGRIYKIIFVSLRRRGLPVRLKIE
ncbi:predicted protein [Plenodomus lingam JN3]|uniref:Predicted protein n=1 Tax=Leptosphaeria maculans (strain JN3 / isolate v23.1.3 / race Av1-4-5-6-7-8) TaxID=985895 RepID=E5AE47_LEPMJ|nr:predicted protein [Plenodomus lingam JN3]CBY01486.1 predicted protein [Plenodomus lingam JN3]